MLAELKAQENIAKNSDDAVEEKAVVNDGKGVLEKAEIKSESQGTNKTFE